jgi:pimeloyl-ACP methyl ester carboxylesterase
MTLAVVLLVIVAGMLGIGFLLYTPDRPRAALEAKYGVVPADYVEAAGMRLYLREAGRERAPAVILLHGFAASLGTWDAWVDALAAEFRVIRFDWPGFGLTGVDPTGDYTDARSLDVLLALMDRLGLARASLVGGSMGGKLAWMFAAAHPARVEKLVLISPDGFASAGFQYGQKPRIPWLLRALEFVLPRRVVRGSLRAAFADPATLSDALLERYRDFMLAPGVRRAMLARLGQTVLEPPEERLRAIAAPTLLLWGEEDRVIPMANAADYRRLISDLTFVPLPGVGHVPQEEAPERSLAAVQDFLGLGARFASGGSRQALL